jgi:hypothetical protein
MEFWSTGVLRIVGIASRVAGLDVLPGRFAVGHSPGLKPWAVLSNHFMVKNATGIWFTELDLRKRT